MICKNDVCKYYDENWPGNCKSRPDAEKCGSFLREPPLMGKKEPVTEVPCSAGLCAELSLMLDVFNSCIETKTLPKTGSPCQEKIIELLKRCGKEPTALKVRGA